ncbi:MAG: Recombination protein recR [Parcubacteria group bacterium Gr01-1014_33]|nr:MAG: Recombination protein recR [Parcubacteria group bacterium Gr01-1014_33]
MYPKPLQNLIDVFTKFPGVGPRQAARFSFFILRETQGLKAVLTAALKEIERQIGFCGHCFRTIEKETAGKELLCVFCRDPKRNQTQIAVVEKESDMQTIEQTRAYQGIYHVLSGIISPLDPDSPKKIHLRALYERVKKIIETGAPCEVILAISTTTEGDTTALYIERILTPLKDAHPQLKISRLGRGLSLGSELEYADEVTIKNALTNRR